MHKRELLYSGKAKTLYKTDDANYLICEFRDDATAFDGVKKAQLSRKGLINNYFNEFICQHLAQAGIKSHLERRLSDTQSLVKNLDMIRVECVVRNIASGSLCRRLGIKDGVEVNPPIFEFFLKDDALHDPLINESHILSFGWATPTEISRMRELTLQVNEVLKPLFLAAGILLVDFKLEFGRFHGDILLADEFSPDGCRLWDAVTRERLDKDRFRHDLGDPIAGYEQAARRIGVKLPT